MKHNFGVGLIVKKLEDVKPILDFLENGKRYGYEPKAVIIALGEPSDKSILKVLAKQCPLVILPLYQKKHPLEAELTKIGLPAQHQKNLLSKNTGKNKPIPYGTNRNQVMIKAMLLGLEALVFIDHDVFPKRLAEKDGEMVFEEVDFFGTHLGQLNKPNVAITSSDYTGYYIVPQLPTAKSERFLFGLQKDGANGVLVREIYGQSFKSGPTSKVLGGNMALKLRSFERILPFFSTSYEVEGNSYLTRGEDTLLSLQIQKNEGIECVDVGMKIFHDTFGDYPNKPMLETSEGLKNRFFYACMGWIGRNPFMNWLTDQPYEALYLSQRQALIETAPEMAAALEDERFLLLPKAIEIAYQALPEMIESYHQFSESWVSWIKLKQMNPIEGMRRESL